jgi:hypothetical protein
VLFEGFVGKSGKSAGNRTMSYRVPAEKLYGHTSVQWVKFWQNCIFNFFYNEKVANFYFLCKRVELKINDNFYIADEL